MSFLITVDVTTSCFLFFFKKYFLPVSITNKTAPALVFACVVLLSVRSQLAVN